MPGSGRADSEMSPQVAAALRAVGEIAGELRALIARLESIAASVPRSADEDAMLELRLPSDVATELLSRIECVLHDNLQPAAESLEKAAAVTAGALRREFRRRE